MKPLLLLSLLALALGACDLSNDPNAPTPPIIYDVVIDNDLSTRVFWSFSDTRIDSAVGFFITGFGYVEEIQRDAYTTVIESRLQHPSFCQQVYHGSVRLAISYYYDGKKDDAIERDITAVIALYCQSS